MSPLFSVHVIACGPPPLLSIGPLASASVQTKAVQRNISKIFLGACPRTPPFAITNLNISKGYAPGPPPPLASNVSEFIKQNVQQL